MSDWRSMEIVEQEEHSEEYEMSETEDGNAELVSVLQRLEQEPYDYNAHTKCIEIYRSSGQLDELRECRRRMREIFALSPGKILQ